jgi:hypothetical protein
MNARGAVPCGSAALRRAARAREARRELEAVLDGAGWPWSRSLSLVFDWLVSIEEETR